MERRVATVTARAEVVGVIDHDELAAMWRTDPAMTLAVVRTLCDRLRALTVLVDELGGQSARSRQTVAAHRLGGPAAFRGERLARVTIEGASSAACASLSGASCVIERFPFRIGRRAAPGDPLSDNDLGLVDREPYYVSRSHCAITRMGTRAFLIDRGSRLGTSVGRVRVAFGAGVPRTELPPGTTEIALGGSRSPFRFRVTVAG